MTKKTSSLCFLLLVVILTPAIQAQTQNRAALVVRFDDGRVETACVAFSEEQINGYDLLVRANLQVEAKAAGMGAAVCRISDLGCPQSDCYCQCPGGSDCLYWSYWTQEADTWQYSSIGATLRQISDGMVDGWSWGPGSLTNAVPPPDLSFADICTDEAATAVPVSQVNTEAEPVNWLPYLVFGLLLVGLAGLAAVRRGRPAG